MNMIRRFLLLLESVPCGCGVLIYEEPDDCGVPVGYDIDTGLPHTCKPPTITKDAAA